MQPLAAIGDRCRICDQVYEEGRNSCWNRVCQLREEDRWFSWNYAIAMRTTWLKTAIDGYKYRDQRHWAVIFGRILVGFLETETDVFDGIDLIVSSPVYVGPGSRRRWDHVREIIVAADREQEPPGMNPWAFDLADPPALIKTADTPQMVGLSASDRRRAAEYELRDALHVTDASRTRGKVIAVFDDIFTGGWTLREEARTLMLEGGARMVVGVSLARQPSTPPP